MKEKTEELNLVVAEIESAKMKVAATYKEAEAKIRFKKEDFAKPIAEKWVGMETVVIKELKVLKLRCFT